MSIEENKVDPTLVKAIDLIKSVNKDVSRTFIFGKDNILAKDDFTTEEQASKTIKAFEALSSKADIIDGLELLTVQGSNGRLDITHINDYYLTIVTSKDADKEIVNNLTHVLAPTIFRIIKDINPSTPILPPILQTTSQAHELVKENSLEEKQTVQINTNQLLEDLVSLDSNVPGPEFAEFTVDDMGRLGIISEPIRFC